MLQELHVKNFALIDEANLEFKDGLNILTGETGSGKSILIGSVTGALGGKVSKDMVREGEDCATIELEFESNQPEAAKVLEKYELPGDAGHYTIYRRIQNTGRSVIRINGETCTQAAVKELAECLLDIHGQHEHQSLLYKKNHLLMLDRFAKDEEAEVLTKLKEEYKAYTDCKKALEEENTDPVARQRETELLEYESKSIRAAELKPGEAAELETEYKRLSSSNDINEAVAGSIEYLDNGNGSAAENIGYALRALSRVANLDENLNGYKEELMEIENLLNDLNRELSSYLDDLEQNPERLYEVTERLDLINKTITRYGGSEEKALKYLEEAEEKLAKYEDYDRYIEGLKKELEKQEETLKILCEELTAIRKEQAVKLEKLICDALYELNFEQVKFKIEVTEGGPYQQNGWDEVEFLISMNPGEPERPLEKVASGGELSRIMLGIKSVLADKDSVESLIFDEIDTGISGRTAQKVAERMAVIADKRQVICITHLPQIAAMADTHYVIEKSTDNIRTTTKVSELSETEAKDEIARLLGGARITESVRENASEMKELATEVKKSLRNR